jgi:hypothetical protein
LLPGFAMCVLEWFVRACRSSEWFDFLPDEPSIEGEDKWYWVYCYAAMRSLGMDVFAERLKGFTEDLIDRHSLLEGAWSYVRFLRALQPEDPLVKTRVRRTDEQMFAMTEQFTELARIVRTERKSYGDAVGAER